MNIVIIFADQMHKYALGTRTSFVKTPNLDALSEKGMSFNYAYSNNPVCGPFRGCLLTGKYTSDCGVFRNGDPLLYSTDTLAKIFNQAGYNTSFVGKWHLGGGGNEPIPKEIRGDFNHFIGYQCYNGFNKDVNFYNENDEEIKYDYHRTDVTTDIAIERLEHLHNEEKPFVHVIGYQAPHYPEQPSSEYYDIYKDMTIPYTQVYEQVQPYTPTYSPYSIRPIELCEDFKRYGNNMQEYMKLYYGMVTQIDAGVGRIIKKLDELNILDDTMIVFTADHGDMQGDHGLVNKCLPYEKSCGIPLIIYNPKEQTKKVINTPVSAIDILPTCLSISNIDYEKALDGRDLLNLDTCEPVFAEGSHSNTLGYWLMIRTKKHKLVINKESKIPIFLFDMENDPNETNNLIYANKYDNIKQELLGQLIHFNNTRRFSNYTSEDFSYTETLDS